MGGFLVWKRERIERNALFAEVAKLKAEVDTERNALAAEVTKLNAEVDRLGRPCFASEVVLEIEEDLQRLDWINIYMNLVIRNQGTESTIDRWRIV
jgi:hypothetical protein